MRDYHQHPTRGPHVLRPPQWGQVVVHGLVWIVIVVTIVTALEVLAP